MFFSIALHCEILVFLSSANYLLSSSLLLLLLFYSTENIHTRINTRLFVNANRSLSLSLPPSRRRLIRTIGDAQRTLEITLRRT